MDKANTFRQSANGRRCCRSHAEVPSPEYPGGDDPQAVWSPSGKQIAYVANGDLAVTDLAPPTGLLPKEKMAVGLPLTCAEEQELAISDLKQIGLGIIQYAQDMDERFPPADGFIKLIYPYVKQMDMFQVDGHPFVYEKPAETMAQVDAPATTEQGYMDLPCARVVLMEDGHVKVFPKQEALP